MKKPILVIAGIIIIAGLVLGVWGFMKAIQNEGMTEEETPEIPSDVTEHIESKQDLIVVDEPQPLSTITSPLTVRGEARGYWYFEAVFQLTLTDWDGRIIAESYASAVLDPDDPESTWMTEDFVPFEGTIEFDNPSFEGAGEVDSSRRGTLIFQRANPSGLPENADALEIPVIFDEQ